jgi:hypothetical protein
MFPKGSIWQQVRADGMSTIPVGTPVDIRRRGSLAQWRKSGYFHVASASTTGFGILTSPTEIGSALLGDAEALLDHATEHHALMCNAVRDGVWCSTAWMLVTAYYWAYFGALSLTRLVGSTVWYIDSSTALQLTGLAATPPTQKAGAGPYKFDCGPIVSLSERSISLVRSRDRLHEAVWRRAFDYLSQKFNDHGGTSSDPLEIRLFDCLQMAHRRLGVDWPSAVRNVVNYRPGFAYRAVQRVDILGLRKFLKSIERIGFVGVLEKFERELAALPSRCGSAELAIEGSPQILGRLTLLLAFLIHGFTWELYSEIISRTSPRASGHVARVKFLSEQKVGDSTTGVWPF